MTRLVIGVYLFGVLIGVLVGNRLWAQQSTPRINPAQVSSYNPALVLFWYVGGAASLPACGGTAPLMAEAYISGPPDQIEACMTGSAGPEWVQVVSAQ
jgi:hypothetical protein